MASRPGGAISARPLHFIWIADCSGSMAGDKIQSLNSAIREALPFMRKEAGDNPNAEVLVRAIKFSSGATWHIAQPTPVSSFNWIDLRAGGVTDLGKALTMVADQLKMPPMAERALPPVLVLISDGYPTDDYEKGLKDLIDQPWGRKALRIAIAIGDDAGHDVLQKFIGNPEILPLQANNPEALTQLIRWASTAVLRSASSPVVQTQGTNAIPIPMPTILKPPTGGGNAPGDVW